VVPVIVSSQRRDIATVEQVALLHLRTHFIEAESAARVDAVM
jgi:hypothetical protein